jgi:hypothetical protein
MSCHGLIERFPGRNGNLFQRLVAGREGHGADVDGFTASLGTARHPVPGKDWPGVRLPCVAGAGLAGAPPEALRY